MFSFRFSTSYFGTHRTSPFLNSGNEKTPKKKSRKSNEVQELEIVKMCLRFLKLDLDFFRRMWDWDEFIDAFLNRGCDLQKFYCNQIVALLFGMGSLQLTQMNKKLTTQIPIESSTEESALFETSESSGGRLIEWNFKSETITGVEGVYLPIFEKDNFKFFNELQENYDKIVRVESTKTNLRSLALGISSGRAICLSGPVGCGKTTLVEYLARKTGRIAPKIDELVAFEENKQIKENVGGKRKLEKTTNGNGQFDKVKMSKNGFLRVQLGDQTDSKVLLGQYRCTDVPGEFLWTPGVLTQAVLNGYWLLLEDLDSATQDVCTVLTNLLENNFLNVPGFRENLKIAPGFQLFVTLR